MSRSERYTYSNDEDILSKYSGKNSVNSMGDSTNTSVGTIDNQSDSSKGQKRETLHSRFEFIKILGKGTYGKVKLANDKRTGKQVAIKLIDKTKISVKPRRLERIRREIDFMANINHPHIVKIFEVYESSEKIILVMEYASGGELYDYLNERKRISETEARGIFRQIVSAVHFLHKNRIVHRDLKLENILIDQNGDIKLADFGLSNNWNPNGLLYTFCGSPLYASPEIVSGIPYYGPEVDCWSLGVLLYTLVYGSMPFQGGDYNRLVHQITEGQFIVPREKSDAYELVEMCLKVDRTQRADINIILNHRWLKDVAGKACKLKLNAKPQKDHEKTSASICKKNSFKDISSAAKESLSDKERESNSASLDRYFRKLLHLHKSHSDSSNVNSAQKSSD